MAELKSLLAFMDGEDRARALARYAELFRAVGPENEDALSVSFGSAVKQVLALEKEQDKNDLDYNKYLNNLHPEVIGFKVK